MHVWILEWRDRLNGGWKYAGCYQTRNEAVADRGPISSDYRIRRYVPAQEG